MKEVKDIIREARESRKWTQEQMADKMGISLRQYNKYESGLFPKYKSSVAEEIDNILGTNIKELIYEQNVSRERDETHGQKLEEPGEEYKTQSQDLTSLINSNKALAESNAALARSNEVLTMMLNKKLIDGAAERNRLMLLSTVDGLREYVIELAAELKKSSYAETKAALGIKVVEAAKKIDQKTDIASDGDR